MLVPVQGGVANLQRRVRNIEDAEAALASVEIPAIYIYNVGARTWLHRIGAGKTWTIPACKPGEEYSDPVTIPQLSVSEFDPASGDNNMGVMTNNGLNSQVGGRFKVGVANDIIGTNSSEAGLSLSTTNLEWFGVFYSLSNPPTKAQVAEAHNKLRQMMELRYSKGAEIVEQKMPENQNMSLRMQERKIYNEAAIYLGYKPLFGDGNQALDNCPECREPIKPGATFCKHCQQSIDPASVANRAKKRAKANEELI